MGEMIELEAEDGHRLKAYVAGPANAHRGLVVVQEIFGVNHHMRGVCDRFATEGYRVIAPALFDRVSPGIELGYTPEDVARGRALRAQVPETGTMADVAAAADWLEARRKAIVGYCWGGTVAWWGATRLDSFAAAVGWYGGGIAAAREDEPHCPVQLHFGEQDASIPMSDVEAIRQEHPGMAIFVYPGAGHGFGCDERDSYSAKDATLALQRTLDFLRVQLS